MSRLLTVNAGSSSLKLAFYETGALNRQAVVSVERIGSPGTQLTAHRADGTTGHNVEAKDHPGALEFWRNLGEM